MRFSNYCCAGQEQCAALSGVIGRSVLDVETQRFSANLATTKSTVGLMVTHTTIDNVLFGSPAYLCQKFKKGDVIHEIDGKKATTHNLIELLVGTDTPGSMVNIKCVRDSGVFQNTFEVSLMRMSTATLVDHRRMFELFTKIKDIAEIEDNKPICELLDTTIELWTKMSAAAQDHGDMIACNVNSLQTEASQAASSMQKLLEQLHFNGQEAVEKASPIAAREAACFDELQSLRSAHAPCDDVITSLRKQVCTPKEPYEQSQETY